MSVTDAVATVGIVDGRVSMSAESDVEIYLETPDGQPLSRAERHATLRVVGDDSRVEVELDADALDALAEELTAAQAGGNE